MLKSKLKIVIVAASRNQALATHLTNFLVGEGHAVFTSQWGDDAQALVSIGHGVLATAQAVVLIGEPPSHSGPALSTAGVLLAAGLPVIWFRTRDHISQEGGDNYSSRLYATLAKSGIAFQAIEGKQNSFDPAEILKQVCGNIFVAATNFVSRGFGDESLIEDLRAAAGIQPKQSAETVEPVVAS